MHRHTLIALACASLVAPALVRAQSADELDAVVVTATRTALTVDESLAPVEVIDRAAIERSQARSLPDLLRGRAGISIANQGGLGKLTSVFVRGAESDHVLVLVDGVRIGSVTSGQAAFQDLPIDLIERVEIVRGPRSSLYGSEAIGGVIQVFTRRGRGGFAPRASIGGGSHDTREATLGFGGGDAAKWFSADYAWRRTEGFNACNGFFNPVTFAGAGCFTTEPDRDGYENHALSLRGGVQVNEAWAVDAHALRSKGSTEFDGSFTNQAETRQQVVGAGVTWTPSTRTKLRLSGGRNVDASDSLLNGANAGYFDTERDSVTLQGDFAVNSAHTLTAGLDWLNDRVDSDTDFVDTNTSGTVRERDNQAAFAQWQGDFGAHDVLVAARVDDNEQFGDHTTGNIAWGWGFSDGWRVTAGYGTAFKAPTFNELYFPFFGNPDLDPERSKTAEVGLAWRGDGVGVRLDAYDTRVDDLIAYNPDLFLPDNIQQARLRGAELTADATIAQWSLTGSVSVVDAENRQRGPNDGNQLPRRARESARIDLDRAFGAFRLGFTGVAEGKRYDNVSNTRRVGGHATLDVRAEYAFNTDWTLQTRLANVFDRDYQSVAFYNQPGREWFVTLRYAPAR